MGDPRVVLGLEEAGKVVEDVTRQVSARGVFFSFSTCVWSGRGANEVVGLTTQGLFSSFALGLSGITIRRFIACYVVSLTNPLDTTHNVNLRSGTPYELGWFLRWALGRVVRVVTEEETGTSAKGVVRRVTEAERRGLVDWNEYAMWREKERGGFPD